MRIFLFIFLFLTFIGPLWILVSGTIDFKADYRTANRASSNLAPDAVKIKEAVIQVYYARTFNWRGIFAVHTWIAIKPENGKQYKVYDVVGWRLFYKQPVLSTAEDIPDRHWFDQKPQIILDLRGPEAEKLISKIDTATANYPYPAEYEYWPGPNSNTYIAYVARHVPELKLALPSNAIGKDFLPNSTFFASAPSGTGYQISFKGILGVMLAVREGLEINLLGLVYGISPLERTIKLPGFGNLKF